MAALTPMMQQYMAIQGAVIKTASFYRLGDFMKCFMMMP